MGEHKHNPAALAAKMGMLPPRPAPVVPVNVTTGHNGKQVIIQYSQKLDFISYTPDQARETIRTLQAVLDNLEQHMAQEKLNAATVEAGPQLSADTQCANEVST